MPLYPFSLLSSIAVEEKGHRAQERDYQDGAQNQQQTSELGQKLAEQIQRILIHRLTLSWLQLSAMTSSNSQGVAG
jgi:hypothetical protein